MPISALARSRIVRFVVVGGVNTVFAYAVYAVLLRVGLNYAVANFAALIAGILFGFKTTGTLVFDNRDNRLLGRFVVCWAVIYLLNVASIKKLIEMGIDRYMAGALPIPAIAALSYAGQKYFVFRKPGGSIR
jgi:putative flippase GtrA